MHTPKVAPGGRAAERGSVVAPRPGPVYAYRVGIVLLAGAFVAWALAVAQMRGMDEGPGTDLGTLGSFLGIWLTMMVAMMLPSAAPMVLTFARDRTQRSTWVFVAGYFAVWLLFGLVAYAFFLLVRDWGESTLEWDGSGRYLAGGAIVAAGLYQLTPAKDVCLRHCRSPQHLLTDSGRDGSALRLGLVEGSYCVGCCFGLFVILFAVGVMSLLWMAVIAGVIFVEKVLPFGERASNVFAVAFILLGLLVALDPSLVPGLTEPGDMMM
jgi:predicted metal-binding membrane protein